MKKLVICILLFSMMCTFTGCTKGQNLSSVNYVDGKYSLTLPLSKKTVEIEDVFEKYIPFMTDELIYSADEKIRQERSVYSADKLTYSFQPDGEGYLCLFCEIIYFLEPSADGDGECGVDHEHKYFWERISTKAFNQQ